MLIRLWIKKIGTETEKNGFIFCWSATLNSLTTMDRSHRTKRSRRLFFKMIFFIKLEHWEKFIKNCRLTNSLEYWPWSISSVKRWRKTRLPVISYSRTLVNFITLLISWRMSSSSNREESPFSLNKLLNPFTTKFCCVFQIFPINCYSEYATKCSNLELRSEIGTMTRSTSEKMSLWEFKTWDALAT